MRPTPGDAVRVEMSKWGDRAHWRFDGLYLGADDLGDWVGVPAGTHHARPGMEFASTVDTVTLAPRDGWWLATVHRPGTWCDVYVDIATIPVWEGNVLRSVDLDLDVVRRRDATVYVDDEDEFAEHQRTLGYPHEVVAAAQRTCAQVLDDVRAARAPYDEASTLVWFERLDALPGSAPSSD